jgi:hypothetical protein
VGFLRVDEHLEGPSAAGTENRPVVGASKTGKVGSTLEGAPVKGSLIIGAKVLEGERTYLSSSSSESLSSEGVRADTTLSLQGREFEDVSSPEAAVAAKEARPISATAPVRGSTPVGTGVSATGGPLERLKEYLRVVRKHCMFLRT